MKCPWCDFKAPRQRAVAGHMILNHDGYMGPNGVMFISQASERFMDCFCGNQIIMNFSDESKTHRFDEHLKWNGGLVAHWLEVLMGVDV